MELHHNTVSHPSPHPLTSHVRAGLGDTGGGSGGREGAGIEGWGWGNKAVGGGGLRGRTGRITKEERLVAEEEGNVAKEMEPEVRAGLGKDGVGVTGLEERL